VEVCIIGGGPAGITTAYQLAKAGVSVDLFEASNAIGGMSRSIELWGQKVDIGPHRFLSNDSRINQLWFEMAGPDYDIVNRLTRIFYRGRLIYYPLTPLNVIANLGFFEVLRCLTSYGAARLSPSKVGASSSFEQWMVNRFGRRLFEIFFKTYSEKLWGIVCSELDADFAAQRIQTFSLGEAVCAAFGIGKAKHKTLVDQFAYPHGGSGMVYERMAEQAKENGAKIHLNTAVHCVVIENGKAVAVEFPNGKCRKYDHIVSTMPMAHLVEQMEDAPAEVLGAVRQLTYRNTIIVFLRIPAKNLFPDNWIYVHNADLRMGRITNFRNWTPHLYGTSEESVLALEYWCSNYEQLWTMNDEKLIDIAKDEISRSKLLPPGQPITGGHVVRIGCSYPVYRRGYKKHLSVVKEFLQTVKNLSPIGRGGLFKYNNQDHSILMGILAAENILKETGHDLWKINTDFSPAKESTY